MKKFKAKIFPQGEIKTAKEKAKPSGDIAVLSRPRRKFSLPGIFCAALALLFVVCLARGLLHFLQGAFASSLIYGVVVATLSLTALALFVYFIVREALGLISLASVDVFRRKIEALRGEERIYDLKNLLLDTAYYDERQRPELERRLDGQDDFATVLSHYEEMTLKAKDEEAKKIVRGSCLTLAALNAVSPKAWLDFVLTLTCFIKMAKAIAKVYGIKLGAASGAKLTFYGLTAGALAGGADQLSKIAGLNPLPARLGEGMASALIMVRLGLNVIEAARPLPLKNADRSLVEEIKIIANL